jgi:glycosyltransferase involved in cell wall biosynthesis
MLIDHYISGMNSVAGGSTRLVQQVCDTLAIKDGLYIRLITQKYLTEDIILPTEVAVINKISIINSKLMRSLGTSIPKIYSNILDDEKPDILHIHGIWNLSNFFMQKVAQKENIPIIIQPHGMLEPWALGWHSKRKKMAMILYQKKALNDAELIIATSQQEKDNIKKLGIKTPIKIIPNGIQFDKLKTIKEITNYKKKGKRKRALFLSRVHPKKGLLNLIHAWSKISRNDWVLQIAGPDEGGHLKEVFDLAKRLNVSDQIEYIGVLNDKEKWPTYYSSDLFILPTFSENFGIVILEALGAGLPVLTTTGTPWSELETNSCGWWVEPNEDAISVALNEALSCSVSKLQKMGINGIKYAKNFDWKEISDELEELYFSVSSSSNSS